MDAIDVTLFIRAGVALAVGLLIGLERGWQGRERAEGERVAGIRTFALIGLLGGSFALVPPPVGYWLSALGFAGLAAIFVLSYMRRLEKDRDISATTTVAALLTYALGVLAGHGEMGLAVASAVLVSLLLGVKPQLHGFLKRIDRDELMAVLKLLVISVVLLPVLPDRGFGPWEALNPYRIWWMVVLIAGLSFAGYLAMRVVGVRRGILLTGILGGLASSTATTINLARLGRDQPTAARLLASGILAASAMMFPRVLVVVAVIAPTLTRGLAAPLLVAGTLSLAVAAWLWANKGKDLEAREDLLPENPFQLAMAVKFGLVLAAVMLLAEGLRAWIGDQGLYFLAAASGLADVDAIVLTNASMVAEETLAVWIAVISILIASFSNSMVKAGLAWWIAGARLGAWILGTLAVALICGGLVFWLIEGLAAA